MAVTSFDHVADILVKEMSRNEAIVMQMRFILYTERYSHVISSHFQMVHKVQKGSKSINGTLMCQSKSRHLKFS